MAPSCCIMPNRSETPHDSAIWPPSMRYIEMPLKFTLLPVGGMPMYSPWWVAWALQWATTLSLSAMRSSMVLSKSGRSLDGHWLPPAWQPRRDQGQRVLLRRRGCRYGSRALLAPGVLGPCSLLPTCSSFSYPLRTLVGQTLPTDENDASYRSTAHALSTGELRRIPLPRTRVNKDEDRKGRG